ncbi:Protein kinase domain-containing protein [Aphelenchoides besseyi]|nr:Protein kinase domain-containing protein [Aphelenchoides besseyi]
MSSDRSSKNETAQSDLVVTTPSSSVKSSTEIPEPKATPLVQSRGVNFHQHLSAGTFIQGAEKSFTVCRLVDEDELSEGYVIRATDGGYMTLKLEREQTPPFSLASEITVLAVVEARRLVDSNDPLSVHFLRLIDHWRTSDGVLCAATALCGPTFAELPLLLGKMSQSTALRLSIQSFEALRHLHQLGYIHGDVRPANFAVGMRRLESVVFFKDLRISRKAGATISPQNDGFAFVGAIRFSSRAMALGDLAQPEDDLESWLYMSRELFSPETLPWRRMSNRREVQKAKERFFQRDEEQLHSAIPPELEKLTFYVQHFRNIVQDYDKIGFVLLSAMKSMQIDFEDPYDWQKRKDLMKSKHFNARRRRPAAPTYTEELNTSEDAAEGSKPQAETQNLIAKTPPLASEPHAEVKATNESESLAGKSKVKLDTARSKSAKSPKKSTSGSKSRSSSKSSAKRASQAKKKLHGSNSQTISSEPTQDEAENSKTNKKKSKPSKPPSGRRAGKLSVEKTESSTIKKADANANSKGTSRPKVRVTGGLQPSIPIDFVPQQSTRPIPNFYFPAAHVDCSISSRHSSPQVTPAREQFSAVKFETKTRKPPSISKPRRESKNEE